ncbi:MAG: hypothetical protein ACJAWV_001847 [Flammeovirgaceae bacterium]|jgi:hypothetical protein
MSKENENAPQNEEVKNEVEEVVDSGQDEVTENSENAPEEDDLMATLAAAKKAREAALGIMEETETAENNEVVPESEDSAEESESSQEDIELSSRDAVVEEASESTVEPTPTEKKEEKENEKLEEVDFAEKSIEELFEISKELVAIESNRLLEDIYKQFQQLKDRASELSSELEEKLKATFLEEGGNQIDFEYNRPAIFNTVHGNFKDFREKRANFYKNLNKEKDDNLVEKNKILDEIRSITEGDDISKVATKDNSKRIKDLQAQWKDIGSVPKAGADELYKSYQAVIDRFYDSKRMAYEFQQLDREKNLKIKVVIVEKAEALLAEQNVTEAVQQLNLLHDEYKTAGPVPRESQAELWKRFKTASDEIYERKRAYAEEYKKQLQENMELKQALCLRAEEFIVFDSSSIKEWNESTKQLLALQEEWDKVGALPREVAKSINKQFWKNFKQFFTNKQAFFNKLDESRKENLEKKIVLAQKAEELQDQTENWDATANELKRLQREWKAIGPVPEAQRDIVYKKFKAACDAFFEQKRNKRAVEDKKFEENLAQKNEVVAEIEKLSGTADVEKLKTLKTQFLEIGFVPRDNMNTLMDKFTNAVDKFFATTDLDEDEREKQSLEVLAEIYKSGPKADERMERKTQAIRNKIKNLENDISLWQNNIQFFAKSKNAEALTKEFAQKIDSAKSTLEKLKRQFKVVKNI